VVLQEALAGKHPTNRDQRALLLATPRTSDIAGQLPAAFGYLIDRMLHPRAAFRPSPRQLVEKFTDLLLRL